EVATNSLAAGPAGSHRDKTQTKQTEGDRPHNKYACIHILHSSELNHGKPTTTEPRRSAVMTACHCVSDVGANLRVTSNWVQLTFQNTNSTQSSCSLRVAKQTLKCSY